MSWEPTLTAKLIAIDRALGEAAIGHAFGGAIALAYCGEPRATKDIDINIALEPSETARVLDALPGVERTGDEERLAERDGQLRVWWDGTAIDLFFGFHDFHHQLAGAHAPAASRALQGAALRRALFGLLLLVALLGCARRSEAQPLRALLDDPAIRVQPRGAKPSGSKDSLECRDRFG